MKTWTIMQWCVAIGMPLVFIFGWTMAGLAAFMGPKKFDRMVKDFFTSKEKLFLRKLES